MSTIPTQNPVPSEAAKDLKFNSGKIDEFVTSMKNKYIDRFGQEHFTIEGLRWVAQQAISQFGYITLDSFQKGAEITLPNQVLRDEATGEYYRWDGALPKIVPVDSNPDSSGGVGVGKWISVGDSAIRQELSSDNGSKMIGWKRNSITSFLRTLDDKVSDFIHLRDFMSDEISVTQALQNAIDYIFSLNVDSPLINYSTNSGYKKLVIGGDLHLIDSPILIPPKKGGVIICDGSLKASDSFHVGEPIFKYDRSGDNSDIKFIDLFFDCNRRANGILFDLYIKNVVDNCHFEAMKDYAIKTQYMGFELMITDCFIQEYWNEQAGSDNPTSTGVIFGAGTSDNHINNTVINSCRHPFEDYGQANAYNMLHIYGNGKIDLDTTRSILGENCQFARFTSCYFDTNILEIRNPRYLDITGACKFVGGSAINNKSFIVFKPTVRDFEVSGVNITGNQFAIVSGGTCEAFSVDLSSGNFAVDNVKDTRIYGNSRRGNVTLRGTRANKSAFGSDSVNVLVDFSDRLLFGANIQWMNYSINSNGFTSHKGSFLGQKVTVIAEKPTNITVYATVDISKNGNAVL